MTTKKVVVSNNGLSENSIASDSKTSKATKSENVIKSIAEIPQVLKEENVKQPVIYLSNTIKGKERNVVLLGETHIATKEEERAVSRILPYFKYLSCEGVDVKGFIEGRFFFWIMDNIVGPLFSILSLWERRSKKNKSSIDKAYEYRDSKTKKVFMLEKGWKPSIRMRIFFIAFPVFIFRTMFMFAISSVEVASNYGGGGVLMYIVSIAFFVALFEKMPLLKDILGFIIDLILDYVFDLGPSRDRNMTKNLVVELNKNETIEEIIVLTGSNHTSSIAKLLKKKYGFVEKSF